MRRFVTLCFLCSLVLATPLRVHAESTIDLLKEAIGLLEKENYAEAREVVAIALDQIDHQMLDATAALIPEKIGEFTRGDVETNKAMGMDLTECTYDDGKGHTVQVQLMGGSGGMLGNIANLGASFGGGRKVRVQGRSGMSMEDNGEVTITLKLKNGKSLIFRSDNLDGKAVNGFAEAFPIATVDESGQ
jgi:hypothetical protein